MAALKIQPSQLGKVPKGTLEKQVLGCWLCRHTTAGRRWVSGRLSMGDESRVTRGIRWVNGSDDPEVARLKRRLEIVLKGDAARTVQATRLQPILHRLGQMIEMGEE